MAELESHNEVFLNNPPQTLIELKNQLTQKDLLWAKSNQDSFIQQIKETTPKLTPPTKKDIFSDERSLYGIAYDWFTTISTTVSEWQFGAGDSLQQAGILEVSDSNGHIINYKAAISSPKGWDIARNIVLNDSYYKRHQELANAFESVDITKPDKYFFNIYLNPDSPEDKALMDKYGYKLEFQETEFGWQPSIDLSHPPSNEFLFTPTATEFFTTLEKSKIQLSDYLKNELINRSENRYGNSYVTLSREVAKLVNNPKRSLFNFFSSDNKEEENQLISKIHSLEIPKDPAAKLLIETIKQIANRQPISDLPNSPSEISFRAGTCKDLECYFSSSVNEGTSYIVEINGKKYLKEGSHHVDVNPMMINLEPIFFNGILFPIGNLFRNSGDGFHYMRATACCFDAKYADQVFGEEYRESVNSWGSPDRIFRLIPHS